MTDDRDRPEPDADTWSAWLPRFDPADSTADSTADTTGAARQDPADSGRRDTSAPPLPQSAGPQRASRAALVLGIAALVLQPVWAIVRTVAFG